jgi:hypothetical protein
VSLLIIIGLKILAERKYRAMNDADGPFVAREFYERLFASTAVDVESIPYALDDAVAALRKKGVLPGQWATFIHMGA